MNPISPQFKGRKPKEANKSKKIKSADGGNSYTYINQVLDFQIKQEELKELREKIKNFRPPRVNPSENKRQTRCHEQAA
jgi:DNA polymerase IIIc chi subunit